MMKIFSANSTNTATTYDAQDDNRICITYMVTVSVKIHLFVNQIHSFLIPVSVIMAAFAA